MILSFSRESLNGSVRRLLCALLGALLLLSGAASGEDAMTGNIATLRSGDLKLVFAAESKRLKLQEVSTGATQWLSEAGEDGSLWQIALEGPESKTSDVSASTLALSHFEQRSGEVLVEWDGDSAQGLTSVQMKVVADAEKSLTRWSLSATVAAGWTVVRADFPRIPNIALRRGLKFAAPAGWGCEYPVKPGMSYGATYPSVMAAMQFTAFYDAARGLYIGLHDVRGSHKRLVARADESHASFVCSNWLALEPGQSQWRLPYQPVIAAFRGSHYEAASLYRDFTFETKWGKDLTLGHRAIPSWMRDTDLWLMPAPEPLENVEACIEASEYFGVPIALHWYRWHEIPFDTLYPEYFPAKPNFAEGVRKLQEAGFRVMPYINGRLCDPNSTTWNEEGGSRWAARKEDGEPYTEVYGSKVPLNVMCPATGFWQDKIAGLVRRLTQEYGVDAVYIDQIGAAHPERCFATGHGHPPGGGTFWVEGYRRMLDQIRRELPEDKAITTEEDGECWNDQLDALLLVNTPASAAARPIPIFPAVYSGRAIAFGFQYIAPDDLDRSLPWRAKMGRAFVWGSQLGWVGVGRIMDPKASTEAEFLRNLSRCRHLAHEFLAEGRFLGELQAGGDNPVVTGEGSAAFSDATYPISMPSVLASVWKSEKGRVGVALANVSDEAHEIALKLPLEAVGIGEGEHFAVSVIKAGEPSPARKTADREHRVTVGARSAAVVVLERSHAQ
ncbi:MAG: hypothetical protein IT209_13075 [Armatimonadetes bacterium]|nr:hypothetical protein [Armatimonadota bacterium]